MSLDATSVSIDRMPATIPVFPLAGVLLLPHGRLPLNIFEQRYLAMTRDSMAGNRVIGMVQPLDVHDTLDASPPVYATGCAGRISSFEETGDDRFLITLTGVCRFAIRDELPPARGGYRRMLVDYDDFMVDLEEPEESGIDHSGLVRALRACFPPDGEVAADWHAIKRTGCRNLVTSLAMMLPFSPSEKQALLEAGDLAERSRILVALMDMMAAQEAPGFQETPVQ